MGLLASFIPESVQTGCPRNLASVDRSSFTTKSPTAVFLSRAFVGGTEEAQSSEAWFCATFQPQRQDRAKLHPCNSAQHLRKQGPRAFCASSLQRLWLGFACQVRFWRHHLQYQGLMLALWPPLPLHYQSNSQGRGPKDPACTNSQGRGPKYPDVSVGFVVVWLGSLRETARVGTLVPEEAEAHPLPFYLALWATVSAFRVPWIAGYLE